MQATCRINVSSFFPFHWRLLKRSIIEVSEALLSHLFEALNIPIWRVLTSSAAEGRFSVCQRKSHWKDGWTILPLHGAKYIRHSMYSVIMSPGHNGNISRMRLSRRHGVMTTIIMGFFSLFDDTPSKILRDEARPQWYFCCLDFVKQHVVQMLQYYNWDCIHKTLLQASWCWGLRRMFSKISIKLQATVSQQISF